MLRGPSLLLLLLLAPEHARAQPVDALLRARGEAFAVAMRAQGEAMTPALTSFAREHLESRMSAEGRAAAFAERMRSMIAELGPVERHVVQVPGETLVFVYLRHARTNAWQNYQFRAIAADGHRLQLVFRATAVEPLARPTSPLPSEDARRYLDSLFGQLQSQQPFSGVAIVSRGGRDVVAQAGGIADTATRTPVTRASRFGMASGSKLFTAVAVLQLAQAGKLSLSDPLARHLPDFPDVAFATRTTIQQLLTHTAGAGDYWDDEYEKHWDTITELRQMLPFVQRHLGNTPAGQVSYSNSGYILLGLVVEAVAGRSYYDHVRERVFEPAGMTDTGFPLRRDPGPGLARPYAPEMEAGAAKPGVYVPVTLGARGTSAGGASTTADDMLRFAAALRGGRLLDRRHMDLLTRTQVPAGAPGLSYGCGAMIDTTRGVVSYGHGGQARGTYFDLRIYPDLDTVLVVMSNYDTIAGPEIASALDHLVRNGG